jgi:alkylated DNA nucleotide flippase Atl1
MIGMDSTHPADAGIDAATVVRDVGVSVRRSRLVRFAARSVARLLRALQESRDLEAKRVIAHYRHLACDSDQQAE